MLGLSGGTGFFPVNCMAISNYITGYYSQFRSHQYDGDLTSNVSELLFWKNSQVEASSC